MLNTENPSSEADRVYSAQIFEPFLLFCHRILLANRKIMEAPSQFFFCIFSQTINIETVEKSTENTVKI